MRVDPAIVFLGFGVGLLVGATGIGGGSLMTPLLILLFGVTPVTAIGSDLAYGAVTKTLGGWRHWRHGHVDRAVSTALAIGSVPAAVAGVFTLKALERSEGPTFEQTILSAVGAVLLLCGIAMLARRWLGAAADAEREHGALTRGRRMAAVTLGAAIGFVLGMTSAGSGALVTVALVLLFRLTPRRVVGTDVFHAAILMWAAALAHLIVGDIDFTLVARILIGSLPGVWIGSAASARVPVGALRASLGLLLIAAGLALVQKASVAIPTPLIAAFPLLVGALLAGAHLRAQAKARRKRPDAGASGWAHSPGCWTGRPPPPRTRNGSAV
jgi:uncharacterized membrane protein YfcA